MYQFKVGREVCSLLAGVCQVFSVGLELPAAFKEADEVWKAYVGQDRAALQAKAPQFAATIASFGLNLSHLVLRAAPWIQWAVLLREHSDDAFGDYLKEHLNLLVSHSLSPAAPLYTNISGAVQQGGSPATTILSLIGAVATGACLCFPKAELILTGNICLVLAGIIDASVLHIAFEWDERDSVANAFRVGDFVEIAGEVGGLCAAVSSYKIATGKVNIADPFITVVGTFLDGTAALVCTIIGELTGRELNVP
jgi:hypothetical protein